MTVSVANFELFLLILIRITGFFFTAPFFSLSNIPVKVKTGLSIFLAIILFYIIPMPSVEYNGVIDFATLIIREAIVGSAMGLFSNIAYHILAFAGQLIDMEIGFSMVNELNPVSKIQSTITANFYGYLVLLIMIVTDLHHYFLTAILDSFEVIPLGEGVLRPEIYQLMLHFVTNYFIIGFRIVLPVFAAILIVNTILAILAKVAPQMNMFVIGLQLKVFVGLIVLFFIVGLVPAVADFIFNEMITMLKSSIEYLV